MSIFSDNLDAFGLDLSDRSIKVAQLKKNENGMYLYAYGRESVPKGLIEDGEIKNKEEVSRLIRKALLNSKPNSIKSRFVVYSIPEPKGFVRIIRVPRVKEDEIREIVEQEAEQQFPIEISESYLDWQILSKDGETLSVLIAAVPRQLVDSYSSVLRAAGLRPVAAEIESIAITRSLIKENQSSRPILIIDLGKDRTSFIIFKNPAVQFTASIPVCGRELNRAVARKLGISEEEAEKIRKECGLKREGKCAEIYEAVESSLLEMIAYIDKLTDYYKEHFESEDISKVVICGGEARVEGINSFLSLKIKKEVEKGNPWVNIISSERKEIPLISRDESLIFVTVLGLAIRGVEKF